MLRMTIMPLNLLALLVLYNSSLSEGAINFAAEVPSIVGMMLIPK